MSGILARNAGIGSGGPSESLDEGDWDRLIDTNLKSAFFCLQAEAAQMKKQRNGAIVFNGSTRGTVAKAGTSVYSTSKGGIVSLASSAAAELGPFGSRVNCTNPSLTRTSLTASRITAGDKSLTTVRMARGTFPGGQLSLNFQEFRRPNQHPVPHRVQDPGGPIMLVQVEDFPRVIDLIRANGGIVGSGETSEVIAGDARSTWTRDPNGVLQQVLLPRSPTAAPPVPAP